MGGGNGGGVQAGRDAAKVRAAARLRDRGSNGQGAPVGLAATRAYSNPLSRAASYSRKQAAVRGGALFREAWAGAPFSVRLICLVLRCVPPPASLRCAVLLLPPFCTLCFSRALLCFHGSLHSSLSRSLFISLFSPPY